MVHLHDVIIGNIEGMASLLCIKKYGTDGEEEGEKERERKSWKKRDEHVATTTMPYHRPMHARIDDVHVYNVPAMDWRTHQFS